MEKAFQKLFFYCYGTDILEAIFYCYGTPTLEVIFCCYGIPILETIFLLLWKTYTSFIIMEHLF